MANEPDGALNDLISAIEKIGVHDHLCLIYETREEQFSAVIPFVKIGLERGEQCVYIVDDNTASMVIDRMKEAGIDVESAVESGRLTIASKQDAYLKQGYFDPDWMIGFLKQATDAAKAAGFSALRVTGEMTWVLGGDPGTERLMEYEAKLNYFFPENDALAICQYNRDFFPPGIIKDVIATHPLVICGGMVCSNFYYIPPDDFLGEQRPDKEIDRLLANINNRENLEAELRRHRDHLEDLVNEQTTELSLMNERLFLATKAAQIGVWDWDIPKNELVWDDSMYRLYGLQIGDFGGAYDAWARTIHPQDKARTEGEIQAALRGEREYGPEFRIVRPDGTIRYIKADSQTFRNEDGKPRRMIGTNIDITELKRAEAERLAHIRFLENLDRVNRVIQGANDLNQMMNDTLETALSIFDCDRTWLFYPCDPDAQSFRVPMEITRPEYPGAGILNEDVPMPPDMALDLREALESVDPVTLGLGTDKPINKVSAEQFGVQAMMMVALYPKSGKPWAFGLHQCSNPRVWTSEEQRLFQEISRRLADALTGLLSHRDLQESEDKLRKLNEELEQRVKERTKELERRNHELEQMNKAFVGRELKMVELKKRIQELESNPERTGDQNAGQ